MDNLERVLIPIAMAFSAILAAILASLIRWKKEKGELKRQQLLREKVDTERIHFETGAEIVKQVWSNNDFPQLEGTFLLLFTKLDELGLKLHTDLRGCTDNGRQ